MKQAKLRFDEVDSGGGPSRRSGPPNRMNDLSYKDWMKFQKSFFRHGSTQSLVEECIYFFTKAIWPNGEPSRSLIIGFSDFDATCVPSPRIIEAHSRCDSLSDLATLLSVVRNAGQKYDFILIDLRRLVTDETTLSIYLAEYSDFVSRTLRQLLVPQRYCGLVVGTCEPGGGGFPLPWAVAVSTRKHLRLRDEKVGLVEGEGRIYYCLFMQAEDDKRPSDPLTPSKIAVARTTKPIPAWTIPKPPPRKPNEILHPAKYPETLVSEFLDLFTKPGDRVLDPMVGTGSTVVAAIRKDRHGYGVELTPHYADIARKRVADERRPSLFGPPPEGYIIQGDATKLSEIPELQGLTFDYAITSPPYWSMLTNPGSENQRSRREKNLPLVYSDDERDLGNVEDYDQFLSLLKSVYDQVASQLVDESYLTVVVKNVKRNHILYPLAWDLVAKLCGQDGNYEYVGTTLWCQDDVGMKPFAVGIYWVSNIVHTYCLHFKKRHA